MQGCIGKLYVMSLFTVLYVAHFRILRVHGSSLICDSRNGRPTTLGAELPTHASSANPSSVTANSKIQSIKFMRGSRQSETQIKVNVSTSLPRLVYPTQICVILFE